MIIELFESVGFPIIYLWVLLCLFAVTPLLVIWNSERKGVGAHTREVTVDLGLQCIYGGKDTHQGHDTKCNDQHRKDGSQYLRANGLECNAEVFWIHSCKAEK